MNATSTRNVVVEAGGTQVVGYVGLHALGSFADRLGVGESLSEAVGWAGAGRPVHDRGRVLTQTLLMLAGGGESCADIETLASQERLFGAVCSDTTLYRTFLDTLDPATVERARQGMARIRAEVWRRTAATDGDDALFLDIDASLVEMHSENKDGAAAHFKGGYGFHPLLCFADGTGDVLSGMLRAGNAAANDTADLLRVLDDAVAQLPAAIGAGHQPSNDTAAAQYRLPRVVATIQCRERARSRRSHARIGRACPARSKQQKRSTLTTHPNALSPAIPTTMEPPQTPSPPPSQ